MSVAEIQQFLQTQLVQEAGARLSTKEVSERFAQFHSKGRNNMHKALRELASAEAGAKFYLGYRLASVAVTVAAPVAVAVAAPAVTAYEAQIIEMKRAKLIAGEKRLAAEIEARKVAAEAEEKRLASEIEARKASTELALKLKQADFEMKKLDIEVEEKKLKIEERKIEESQKNREAMIEQKMADRAWGTIENNKTHMLTLVTSPYFRVEHDPKMVGNNAKQYELMESLVERLQYNTYEALGRVDPRIDGVIKEVAEANSETIDFHDTKGDDPTEVQALGYDALAKTIDEVYTKVVELDLVKDIPNDPKRHNDRACLAYASRKLTKKLNEDRTTLTSVESARCIQPMIVTHAAREVANTNKGSKKSKRDYENPSNRVFTDIDGVVRGMCGPCNEPVNLEDPATHLAHIHPKSQGGTFSKDNIVIACSKCNLNMKEESLFDFKIRTYHTKRTQAYAELNSSEASEVEM